jgi:hypothetical protein
MHRIPAFLIIIAIYITACDSKKDNVTAGPVLIDSLTGSENNFSSTDQSPMDMSYYPGNYPLLKMDRKIKEPLVGRVIYSRPHKKGRVIFGNTAKSLCPYGKEWRLGANEATEIEFFRDVFIKSNRVERGRYVLYCIPYPDKWTLVFNSNLYTWGLHMDHSKDILKVDVPVQQLAPSLEDFTMVFLPATYGTDLLMAWDNVKVLMPVSFTSNQ